MTKSADINRIVLHCSCVLNKQYGSIDLSTCIKGLVFVVAGLLASVGKQSQLFILFIFFESET